MRDREENKMIHRLKNKILGIFIKTAKKIPAVKNKMNQEYAGIMADMEKSLKPYRGKVETFSSLPTKGLSEELILSLIEGMNKNEEKNWKNGKISGAVYHGDKKHIDFLNNVYSIVSQVNPLHADIWPSASKYEAEIIAMTGNMMHSAEAEKTGDLVCGSVTSGGTESILLAMKTYRDMAREKRGIHKPEIIAPVTAHAAFDKASQYFNIRLRKARVDGYFRVDLSHVKSLINKNTIALVGSAPSFPHGMVDDIPALSDLAYLHGIPFHTDACLGGFLLPWVEKLGVAEYNNRIPVFDFRLRGVTSLSVDTHKYGFAAKGTSVVLYRNPQIRRYQFFKVTDWPGGLYYSPTFAGSRPGALLATAWASLIKTGASGYMDSARKIMKAADIIREGIRNIPGLEIMGDPLWNIAFTTGDHTVYRIMEAMNQKGWSLNGLHQPPGVHICATLVHTRKNLAVQFVEDLKEAATYVREHPEDKGHSAPVYGMAASFPDRETVGDLLDVYMDTLYKL